MANRMWIASALLLTAEATAQEIEGLYNTGVTAAGTSLLPQGAPDPAWSITSPAGLAVVAFRFPVYFPNAAGNNPAGWVSGVQGSAPVGNYTYQEQFLATAAGAYTFAGEWGVDNCGVISVDGTKVSGTGTSIGYATGTCRSTDLTNFQIPTPFSFTASLTQGLNTMDFMVYNGFCGEGCINPSALFVRFNAPEPGALGLMMLAVGALGLGLARNRA